ncbi:serine/threonine-protein kinase [Microbacterium sp. SS28]|uniref:serine/threonine-protein kinase n=1 Tax=Microbacterium sp. SS28 TaxID=2919948 RepID=UPI001FAA4C31|nr:serine/threonine-protein kinase [Microbacterium sp. SS28]
MTTPLVEGDPQNLGDVRLSARIGEGGSAVVFLGHRADGTAVAVKVLHRHLATSQPLRELLAREATALERVQGSRVARVLGVESTAELPYLVVEYVPGASLAAMVATSPLAGAMASAALDGVAEALQTIHAAGIVHRDLKPSNIIYGPDGIRVVDFGISAIEDVAGSTRTGALVGTPSWLSPEQAVGKPVTAASDVFNFGMLIVFITTGRNPFGEGRPDAMLYRVVNEAPDLTDVPEPLRGLASGCLAKDPESRPPLETVRSVLASFVGNSGQTDEASNSTVLGSATALARAAHVEAAGPVDADSNNSSSRIRTRRWPIIAAAAALVLVVAALGLATANAIAPFGGAIELEYDNALSGNMFVERPTIRIKVENGEGSTIAFPSGRGGELEVGKWHPDSKITVAYEPTLTGDEAFQQTWTAGELGLNVLSIGQPLQISVRARSENVTLTIHGPKGTEGREIVLSRGDVQGCIDTANEEWRAELAKALGSTQAYLDAHSRHRWNTGEWEDWSIWSARATGMADDLFALQTEIVSAASANEGSHYSAEVSSAQIEVVDDLVNLGRYWDDYSASIAVETREGSHDDLYPRERARIKAGEDLLWDDVAALNAAIDDGAATACFLSN